MSEKNKFEQFGSDMYENEDFSVEDFDDDKVETKESSDTKKEEVQELNENISSDSSNDIELSIEDKSEDNLLDEVNDESDPFQLEGGQDIDLEQELNKETTVQSKSIDKKKILIIGGIGITVILIIIVIVFLFSGNDNTNSKKVVVNENKFASLNEVTEDENVEEGEVVANDVIDTNASETGLMENGIEEVIEEVNTEENTIESSSNHKIDIPENSNDEVINITEAILSPSSVKVKMNTIGEFDGIEENTGEGTSFIKIKENSLVIPTVSKANFIPDVKIEVLNTQKQYSATDLIKIEFNVLLNSKTLSYSVSKKIYKDKDFIIDLSLNNITTDIVSIEENLIKEEVIIPINIMNSGVHTVYFKIDNYPVETYTYNIK